MGLITADSLNDIPFDIERVELGQDKQGEEQYLYVRELLGGDVPKVYNNKDDENTVSNRMVLYAACDEKGERVFKTMEQVGKLKLSWIAELAKVGFEINNRALGVDGDEENDVAKN